MAAPRPPVPARNNSSRSRSRLSLSVGLCWHAETIPPLIHSACRNADRVFCAAVVVTKLAVTDIAQHGSLIQTRPRCDLRRFEKLLDRREREYDVQQLRPGFCG